MVDPDTFLATLYVMSEQGFYRYAKRHPGATFPTLPYRGQFNRLLRRHYGAIMAFLSQKPSFLIHYCRIRYTILQQPPLSVSYTDTSF